jgi:MSHA biogenesis protein MshO
MPLPVTSSKMISRRHHRGFTLIEAIAVIVITGIIGSVVAVFIARPVQGYVDSARRAVLSDMADTSLRRVGRDIRIAVPNTLRVTGSGANTYLEFVPGNDGVRYRIEKTGGAGDILDFTSAADNSFDVFGVSAVSATANDYLVIFNTGQCDPAGCAAACTSSGGANAYQGCNRRTLTGATAAAISYTATGLPIPFDSPGHRLQTVPSTGPVTYACEGIGSIGGNGAGTLKRYTGYASGGGNWNAQTQPTTFATGSNSLLADTISACSFSYSPGVTQRSGLATLLLTLTRVNESVTLYYEVHVDNQP